MLVLIQNSLCPYIIILRKYKLRMLQEPCMLFWCSLMLIPKLLIIHYSSFCQEALNDITKKVATMTFTQINGVFSPQLWSLVVNCRGDSRSASETTRSPQTWNSSDDSWAAGPKQKLPESIDLPSGCWWQSSRGLKHDNMYVIFSLL